MIRNLCFIYSFVFLFLISSCTFTKKIKDGTMAFELKQYAVAVEMLEEEFISANDERSKARIAYTIGESYWEMGEIEQALPWYSKAISNQYGPKAIEKKAFTLKQLERYKEAASIFQSLLQESPQTQLYRKELAICKLSADWILSKRKKFEVERAFFNSRQSDYAPAYRDNQHIFFSSDRESSNSSVSYNWTGRSFSDIYMYNTLTGAVSHFDPVINTNNNEGTLCFSGDGSRVYFTRCFNESEYDDFCKIMYSEFVDGVWTLPRKLPFVQEGINYGHPFWSDEQNVLFFSSEQQIGFGGFDIYFSKLDTSGIWSEPRVLNEVINTIGDEKFPSLKGDTLFFASDGHLGMGGLDIFYTYIDKNGNWTSAQNMKSPINSGADDFAIVFENYGDGYNDAGYFSSSRNGSDDIYTFSRATFKEEVEIIVEKEITDADRQLKLAITILAEDDFGNKSPFPQAKLMINGKSKKLNNKGFIFQDIDPGDYNIQISNKGYFSVKQILETSYRDVPANEKEFTYNKTIILKPIIENKEIVLENIFYDFNKSFIREDAKPSLIELASLLKENPEISIELSSHTDCRGPDGYNQTLSQDRAQAAVDYIVNLGIENARIAAKGYGESTPKATCSCDDCSEDEHQLNRRTSFKITGIANK